MLWKKHNYLNKNIEYLISNEIIEYDMKSAGFNLIKKFNMLSVEKINWLETLPNKQRQRQIGLIQRKDKAFARALNEKFIEARRWFFEGNNLEHDDVLSIKKDAIISTKRCHVLEFDNIIFAEKTLYTSYYYLNKYEFYYNSKTIDVKGINDELLEYHRDYMLDFLYNFFKMNEISSRKKVSELLLEFAYYYKKKRLNIGYYRELNVESMFKIHETLFGRQVGIMETGDIDEIDISYNYVNYIVPLISILI